LTAKPDLIELLSRRPGTRVSGSDLAQALGMTRAAVHKRVAKLRAQGFRIDGASRLGYRWVGAADRLEPGGLRRGFVRDVHLFDALPSTQDEAKTRALAGAPEGTLIVADRQTAGRGRLGRAWVSPPGGLWYSILLRPPIAPDAVPALILVAALDWARVLEARGVPARLKWPNDLWVEGRKVAGLLTEMSAEMDRVHWAVLGVGVNVANDPPGGTDVPAASLKQWLGDRVTRQELLAAWIDRFSKSYRRFAADGFVPFRPAYAARSWLRGRAVRFQTAAGAATGRAAGVDATGRLMVETPRGTVAVAAGEVSLLRLNSR
jgi:BirA family biotin operon repressor/biotin-[acetyl-CoA-carboxylase] ligase